MIEDLKIKLIGKLLSGSEILKELKIRKSDSYQESHPNGSAILKEKLLDGWQIKAELKTTTKIFKTKPPDIAFEDKLWTLFALLGFKLMNKDRHFHIPYDKNNTNLTQQIDVFAKDDSSEK